MITISGSFSKPMISSVVTLTLGCKGAEDPKHTLYGQTCWDASHLQLVELPIPTELKDYFDKNVNVMLVSVIIMINIKSMFF